MAKTLASALLIFSIFCASCKLKSEDKDPCHRGDLVKNYAENLILPAFADVLAKVRDLNFEFQKFKNAPSAAALPDLQQDWVVAFQAWQNVNAYNFGPAGEQGLKMALVDELGKFPAYIVKIDEFVAAADFSLVNSFRDSRGFLAVEYLLFAKTDELLTDENRRKYLEAVLNHLENELARVDSEWKTDRTTFENSIGLEAGSSIALLFNEFSRSFENMKNKKVAFPAGKLANQLFPSPASVEGFYSGQSLDFLKRHIAALENVYEGRSALGVDGIGLKDYLECRTDGVTLVADIEISLAAIHAALDAIPTDKPLSELIALNHPSIPALLIALQQHSPLFTSDMASILSVTITFDSSDGD